MVVIGSSNPFQDLYPVRPVTAGAEGQSGLTGLSPYRAMANKSSDCLSPFGARANAESVGPYGVQQRMMSQESYSYCGGDWAPELTARSRAGTAGTATGRLQKTTADRR
ncbi:hypothetical protein OUZ56_016442 [Daphnia magna]|uniref:Uncharacterized protein n=1 Tax=Daphnia magna TaxID=35525 RepID=A0ABR0AQJ4_9CRUS|nr:hypothetical protein OUZ56_016442 [Daphnia magna]